MAGNQKSGQNARKSQNRQGSQGMGSTSAGKSGANQGSTSNDR